MKRASIVFVIALLALSLGALASRHGTAQAADDPTVTPSVIVGQFPAAYPAADNVTFYETCMPTGQVQLQLSWTSYNVGTQFVDLSLFNNGFIPGSFIGNGPLSPAQNSLTWYGLTPNATHFLRVNTFVGYLFWQASDTMVFQTRGDCSQYSPQPITCGSTLVIPQIYQPYCPPPSPPIVCNNGYSSTGCILPPPQPVSCNSYATSSVAPSIIYQGPIAGGYSGCVSTSQSVYSVGQFVQFCYQVSMPMYVRIVSTRPDGGQTVPVDGYDNGQGGCYPSVSAVGYPQGVRTVQLYGGPNQNQLQVLNQTTFTVQ